MGFHESQLQAIRHKDGPMLVLAGPGSGKTTVITHRIRNLVEEYHADPGSILVITFTKAAAQEMKLRFQALMEGRRLPVSFGTFHGVFFSILKHAYRYNASNIIREEQRMGIIRELMGRYHVDVEDEAEFANGILSEISAVKGDMINLDYYYAKNCSEELFKKLYQGYMDALVRQRLLDFDDMLVMCYELFTQRKDILAAWQQKYQYILIDEFQDINRVQYEIVRMLAAPQDNLFIVGDDDQSIYKFRGANIQNILGYEKVFPEAKVIKLEQNYRSTSNILNAANMVIRNNRGRKDKTLWTQREEGAKIRLNQCETANEEAERVVSEVKELIANKVYHYSDCAVLYRTNAQSRILEEQFVRANIPYKIVGGINFYARKEIKDLLAYLKTIDGGRDNLAVRRIINIPKRGIGLASIDRVQDYAEENNLSFYCFSNNMWVSIHLWYL